ICELYGLPALFAAIEHDWIGTHFGWRVSFSLVALLAGGAGVMLLLSRFPKAAEPPGMSLKNRLAPLREPRLLLALAPAFLLLVGFDVIYIYIAPLLQQNLHIADISGLLMALGAGAVVGNLFGGRLADRFGAVGPMMITLVVVTVLAAVFSPVTTTLIGSVL